MSSWLRRRQPSSDCNQMEAGPSTPRVLESPTRSFSPDREDASGTESPPEVSDADTEEATPNDESATPVPLATDRVVRLQDMNHHLGSLPRDVLVSLLQGTTGHAKSLLWYTFLDVGLLLHIHMAGGTLLEATKTVVPAIETFDRELAKKPWGRFQEAAQRRDALRVDITHYVDASVLRETLKVVGAGLERLSLVVPSPSVGRVRVHKLCPALREIVLVDRFSEFALEAVLAERSGEIRVLEITTAFLPKRFIDAIENHGEGIEHLAIRAGEIGSPLKGMWEAVGPTLHKLTFGRPKPLGPDELPEYGYLVYEDIPMHCTLLRTVAVEDIGDGLMPISAIMRFGEQLECVEYITPGSCEGPEKLKMILDQCPNVKLAVFVEKDGTKTLETIGNRMNRLKIYAAGLDTLERGPKSCEGLKIFEAKIRRLQIPQFLNFFFARPSANMKEFHVDVQGYYSPGPDQMNIFDAIAGSVSDLDMFSCKINSFSPGTFTKFAKECLNIKSVQVHCERIIPLLSGTEQEETSTAGVASAEQAAVSFLEDFSQIMSLEELFLEDRFLNETSEILKSTSAAMNLKNRAIDVCIGGVQYNP